MSSYRGIGLVCSYTWQLIEDLVKSVQLHIGSRPRYSLEEDTQHGESILERTGFAHRDVGILLVLVHNVHLKIEAFRVDDMLGSLALGGTPMEVHTLRLEVAWQYSAIDVCALTIACGRQNHVGCGEKNLLKQTKAKSFILINPHLCVHC